MYNVGKTIINHQFFNGLCHLFMVISGMVYHYIYIYIYARQNFGIPMKWDG